MRIPIAYPQGLAKALKAFGLIALGALAAVGLVSVVERFSSPAALTAVEGLLGERIEVVPDLPRITSGGSVELAWTHSEQQGEGTYVLTYPCVAGVHLEQLTGEIIPCDSGVSIAINEPVAVVAVSETDEEMLLPVSVVFISKTSEGRGVSGSTTIAIAPATPPSPPSAIEPPSPQPPAAKPPPPATVRVVPGPAKVSTYPGGSQYRILPNGVPDLSISVIATGLIDDSTGEFQPAAAVTRLQQAGVVFDVTNIGAAVSDQWRFSTNLPTFAGLFTSDPQPALAPGERIRFTIGFRYLILSGPNAVVFTLDPGNSIRDANRSNDVATTTVIRSD